MISDEFYKFCVAHGCAESVKERSTYCPIADLVRDRDGVIIGGESCEIVYRGFIKQRVIKDGTSD